MSDTQQPGTSARKWTEDGRLYLWGGTISAIVSWILIPLFGLFAVFSGYKLYGDDGRTVSPLLIAGLGAIGFASWVVYLFSLL